MKIRAFAFATLLSLFVGLHADFALAGAAKNLDEFVERLDAIFRTGADYEGLTELIDPLNRMEAGIATLTSVVSNHTQGSPLEFVEMFRNQTAPSGVKIIGALIGEDGKTAMFLSFILLKHDGTWRAVQINGQSNFEKIPAPYH